MKTKNRAALRQDRRARPFKAAIRKRKKERHRREHGHTFNIVLLNLAPGVTVKSLA